MNSVRTLQDSDRKRDLATRFGAGAGLLFALVYAYWISIVVSGPTFAESGTGLREFIPSNGDTLLRGSFLLSIGYLFLLIPFAVALDTNLGGSIWSRVALIGLAVSITINFVELMLGNVFATVGVEGIGDAGLEVIWTGARLLIAWLFHLATGMWVAAMGMAVVTSQYLPRWIGWVAIGLLVPQVLTASFVLSGEMTEFQDAMGGIGQIGAFVLWIPAMSILILRRSSGSAPKTSH